MRTNLVALTKNSFVLNKSNYLQIQSTAMGTRTAPSYANLFMRKLEREFLQTQDKVPRVWWRYIDDLFDIWAHGKSLLRVFIKDLTSHHPTIKFTGSSSAGEETFLDTSFYLRKSLIGNDLHVEPTDTSVSPYG